MARKNTDSNAADLKKKKSDFSNIEEPWRKLLFSSKH